MFFDRDKDLPERFIIKGKEWWTKPDLHTARRLRHAPQHYPVSWEQCAGLVGLIVEANNRLAKYSNKVMLEIGSHMGESGTMFAGSNMFDTVYLVDLWKNIAACSLCEFNSRIFPSIKMIKGDSTEISKIWTEKLDMVYIDGEHTYEAVTEDIQNWLPHLKEYGIISGHDYFDNLPEDHVLFGVKRAVDDIFGAESVIKFADGSWMIK